METWIWALINLLYWVNWQTFNNSIWIIYQYGNNNMAQIDHLILCIYAKVTFQKHQSNSRKHRPPGLKRIMALRQANSAGSMFSWRNLRINYSKTSGQCDPEKSKKYWVCLPSIRVKSYTKSLKEDKYNFHYCCIWPSISWFSGHSVSR